MGRSIEYRPSAILAAGNASYASSEFVSASTPEFRGEFFNMPNDTNFDSGLRRVPVDGGEWKEVLPSLVNTRAFFVVEEGVYFIPAPGAEKRTSIQFLEFSSGKIGHVAPN
jgi:hypothetical protein